MFTSPTDKAGMQPTDLNQILQSARSGDTLAPEQLLALVYDELRRVAAHRMAGDPAGQTLQPTALVHEAWLRLGGDQQAAWQSRAHFFAAAAEAMRRILIDRARKRQVRQAAGLREPVELDEAHIELCVPPDELLAVNDALEALHVVNPAAAQLVKLRYFVGMEMPEAAQSLGLPLRTAERLWTFSRAWMRNRLRRPE